VSGSAKRRPALIWVGGGLVIAVAIVVFLATRGGGGGGPLNAIAEAAEVTQKEPGGHIVVHANVAVPGHSESLAMSGRMVFNVDGATSGVMTVPNPKGGKPIVMRMIGTGESLYLGSHLFGNDKWLGFGLNGSGSSAPVPAQTDAGQQLEALVDATGAEKVGTAKVRGVETTKYRGSLKGGDPIEVWIDGQERIRRTRLLITEDKAGEGRATKSAITMDYYDFGPVPEVKPPDPSEVISAEELVKAGPPQ
jgi:hypothetical protein